MNNRHEDLKPRRTTQIQQKDDTQQDRLQQMSRSMFSPYQSFMDIFSGIFRTSSSANNNQESRTHRDTIEYSERTKNIQEHPLTRSVAVNIQNKNVFQKPKGARIKDKIQQHLLPNRQKITQKLFKILSQRVDLLENGTIQPIFMQSTISTSKDDIKTLFSNSFMQYRPDIIRNLNLILKCFSIHRLDIGQRKCIALLSGITFAILNENIILTFIQLCHIALSPTFLGFLLLSQNIVDRVERKIDLGMQDWCSGLYVLLNNKYRVLIKHYAHQWIGSLFMCLQLQGTSSRLDRYYENNEDEFILKLLYYLFLNKLSQECLIHTTLCMMKALQKQIFRQNSRESVLNIFKRPRSFIDQGIFLKSLFN